MDVAVYSTEVGLASPTEASAALSARVAEAFALSPAIRVSTSALSRHSVAGMTAAGDIIIYRDNGDLRAAQVWAHLDVSDVPLTLVQQLDLLSENRAQRTSLYSVVEHYAFIATELIHDAVVWNTYDTDVIRIILPLDA